MFAGGFKVVKPGCQPVADLDKVSQQHTNQPVALFSRRQLNNKPRAPWVIILNKYSTAMLGDNVIDNGQAQPGIPLFRREVRQE